MEYDADAASQSFESKTLPSGRGHRWRALPQALVACDRWSLRWRARSGRSLARRSAGIRFDLIRSQLTGSQPARRGRRLPAREGMNRASSRTRRAWSAGVLPTSSPRQVRW